METNYLTPGDSPNQRRRRKRLADAVAEDRDLALKQVQNEHATGALLAVTKEERLGALIIAVANRSNRVADLSTVLIAAARRGKDAVAISALANSHSPKKKNVK